MFGSSLPYMLKGESFMSESNVHGKGIIVSPEGLKKLEEQLKYLETVRRPEVADQIRVARGFGDLSENAEYDAAKNEQSKLEAEIAELTQTIATAVVMDESDIRTDRVTVGTSVTIQCKSCTNEDLYEPGEKDVFTIVGARESNPAKRMISNESAIGSALLGKRVGEEATVSLPDDAEVVFIIEKIEKAN